RRGGTLPGGARPVRHLPRMDVRASSTPPTARQWPEGREASMTEADWLASEDPAGKLGGLSWACGQSGWGCRATRSGFGATALVALAWQMRVDQEQAEVLHARFEAEGRRASRELCRLVSYWFQEGGISTCPPTHAEKAAVLRDIMGNPFR